MGKRIYVCHTYYHVYVALLKEIAAGYGDSASIMLSTMSNDFGNLKERLQRSPLVDEVFMFDEKEPSFFPELAPLKEDTGSLFTNLLNRIRFQKALAKALSPYIPVDLRTYDDIYVFCDSDPIGYYLNANRIPYHAVEDGLDCLRYFDTARYDNRSHFGIKALLAATGLIFIQNGYARYCIDMEVNDTSVLKYPHRKMKALPRKSLAAGLTADDKAMLVSVFLEDADTVCDKLKADTDRPKVLLLTEPLCDLDTRKLIFKTLYEDHCRADLDDALVTVKRHPRDLLDHGQLFADEIRAGDVILLDEPFPMEVLNFLDGVTFERVVSVYTVVDMIENAKEKIYLGDDFMDRYEDPAIHRQNEYI